MSENRSVINALTIDVEDYWAILARDWLHQDNEPCDAVVRNTRWFLETFDEYRVKATFFVLGEVARKFPQLIEQIAHAGHEIGVHGDTHQQIFKLTKEQFSREVGDTKKLLEDITAQPVQGHRAPAFSITKQTQWALDLLVQEGFKYDSSIFPITGKRYGWPGFAKDICKLDLPSGKTIIEVPLSTVRLLGKDLPAAGGGYLRHLPYAFTKWAIKNIQKQRPAIVYIHPCEIDTQPRPFQTNHLSFSNKKAALRFHCLQARNKKNMRKVISRLLSEFDFDTVGQIIKNKEESGL